MANLDITSFYPSSPAQIYGGKYLYVTTINSSDVGRLSSVIASVGDSYRKVTPTATLRNKITITSNSDTKVKGYLHLYS